MATVFCFNSASEHFGPHLENESCRAPYRPDLALIEKAKRLVGKKVVIAGLREFCDPTPIRVTAHDGEGSVQLEGRSPNY